MTAEQVKAIPTIALSVRQPWAWAIIHGGKDVENRTKYAITLGKMRPQRIAIHASKGMTRDEYESAKRIIDNRGAVCPRPDELVRGGLIGSVAVTGIVKESDSPWFFGPWALELAEPHVIAEPIACQGQLGYFRWSSGLGVAFAPVLPWMIAWPNDARRAERPTSSPDYRMDRLL